MLGKLDKLHDSHHKQTIEFSVVRQVISIIVHDMMLKTTATICDTEFEMTKT